MKARITLFAVLALALASTACQQPAQEAAGLSEEDVSAIRGVVDALREADLAGDWEAVVALYAEDAVFMMPDQPEFGRAAWRAGLDEAQMTFHEVTFEVAEIDGRADLAFLRGTYSATVSVGEAEPEEVVGKIVWILKKQPDGSWLIALQIWLFD
jgi:uncharacterized protein (TIGR02246 family)